MSSKRRSGQWTSSAGCKEGDVPEEPDHELVPNNDLGHRSPTGHSQTLFESPGTSFFIKESPKKLQFTPSITMGPCCETNEPPKPIDLSKVPRKLSRLQRSPEHRFRQGHVWTTETSGEPSEFTTPTEIILTDVALNQPPELLLTASDAASDDDNHNRSQNPYNTKKASGCALNIPQQGLAENHDESEKYFRWKNFLSGFCGTSFLCFFKRRKKRTEESEETVSQSEETAREPVAAVAKQDAPQIEYKQESFNRTGAIPKYLQRGHSSFKKKSTQRRDNRSPETVFLELRAQREMRDEHYSKYFDDIRVFHNIHRREMIARLLYREAGQLYPRTGTAEDPHPPLPPSLLLAGHTPPPPLKRDLVADPLITDEARKIISKKVMRNRPRLDTSLRLNKRIGPPTMDESGFAESCLNAHNIYRARHLADPLVLSSKLCSRAQNWANHLAQTARLRHGGTSEIGENIFCRNYFLSLRTKQWPPIVTGDEVTAYWYSDVRQYRFKVNDSALQAHSGSFSQMVWMKTKEFGIGKSFGRTGKLIIVAHYYPPGNIAGEYRSNVQPLSTRALAAEMLGTGNSLFEDAILEADAEAELDTRFAPNKIVSGVLAAQPPNITGRNATKILAAHMLGHAASVVTTADEKLEVVILSHKSPKKKSHTSSPFVDPIRRTFSNNLFFPPPLIKAGSLTAFPSPALPKTIKTSSSLQEVPRHPISESLITKPMSSILKKKRQSTKVDRQVIKECESSSSLLSTYGTSPLQDKPGPQLKQCVLEDNAHNGTIMFNLNEVVTHRQINVELNPSIRLDSLTSSQSKSEMSGDYNSLPDRSYSLTESNSNALTDPTSYTEGYNDPPLTEPFQTMTELSEFDDSTSGSACNSIESNILSGYSEVTKSTSTPSSSSATSTPLQSPKKCVLRRIRFCDENPQISTKSNSSIDPGPSSPKSKPDLNLPFDSPDSSSGVFNCLALSPLRY